MATATLTTSRFHNLSDAALADESVSGGLGKRLDFEAELKAAGFTTRQLRSMRLLGSLTKAEFEQMLAAVHFADATSKATERESRRIIRARR
jgi:hypothetical protein